MCTSASSHNQVPHVDSALRPGSCAANARGGRWRWPVRSASGRRVRRREGRAEATRGEAQAGVARLARVHSHTATGGVHTNLQGFARLYHIPTSLNAPRLYMYSCALRVLRSYAHPFRSAQSSVVTFCVRHGAWKPRMKPPPFGLPLGPYDVCAPTQGAAVAEPNGCFVLVKVLGVAAPPMAHPMAPPRIAPSSPVSSARPRHAP